MKYLLLILSLMNLPLSYACEINETNEELVFLPHTNKKFSSQQFISWVREQNEMLSSVPNPGHFVTVSAKIHTMKNAKGDLHNASSTIKTVEFSLQNAQLFPQQYFDQFVTEITKDAENKAWIVIQFLKINFDPISFQFLPLLNRLGDFFGFSTVAAKLYKDKFFDKYTAFIERPINDANAKVKDNKLKSAFLQIMNDLHGAKLIGLIQEKWKFPIVKILAGIDPDSLSKECTKATSFPKDPIFQKKTSFIFNNKPYEICCLPSHDPVNFLAGLITDCCMHLGHDGKIYSILATQLPSAAMLFILKKGQPVANSFATLLTTNPSGNKERKALVINCIVFNREISPDAISCALAQHFLNEPYDVYYGLRYNYGMDGKVTEPRYYTPVVHAKYPMTEALLEKSFVDLVRSYPPAFSLTDPVQPQDSLCAIDFMREIGSLSFQSPVPSKRLEEKKESGGLL